MRISDWSSDVCSSDLIGLVAVAAASPVASQKLSTNQVELDPLYYFYRQLLWVGVGVPIMLVISMLPRVQARRFSIFLTVLLTVLLMLVRSEEHTSELQSLMRISYAVFCLKKKKLIILSNINRIDKY